MSPVLSPSTLSWLLQSPLGSKASSELAEMGRNNDTDEGNNDTIIINDNSQSVERACYMPDTALGKVYIHLLSQQSWG